MNKQQGGALVSSRRWENGSYIILHIFPSKNFFIIDERVRQQGRVLVSEHQYTLKNTYFPNHISISEQRKKNRKLLNESNLTGTKPVKMSQEMPVCAMKTDTAHFSTCFWRTIANSVE